MISFRKSVLASVTAMLLAAASAAAVGAQSPDTETQERLDALYADLAEAGRTDWQKIEAEITGIWSRSGSQSMDLLLRRGMDLMENGEFQGAVDHFSALTEQAPDFAEGWNARATAYYLQDNFELSLADIQHVLALNPSHFGALSGLAAIFEQMGQLPLALEALHAVQELNPNRPSITTGIERIEREIGSSSL